MPIVKDSLKIGSDQKLPHDASAGDGIFDVVSHERAIVTVLEGMFVNSERVGAFGLPVDETVGWIPGGDLALPTNGNTADSQVVIE